MFQQIVIIVSSIFGLFIMCFVVRYVAIPYVSPKTEEKIQLYFILKDINHYYGFLLEKGFNIRSAEYIAKHNGNWVVQFESKYCIVHIVQDRGNIEISFTLTLGSKLGNDYIGLVQMISLVTQTQVYVGGFENYIHWKKKLQFRKTANLLTKHIDQILLYFKNNYNEREFNRENEYTPLFEK
ncbi:MAG: hypothetical protein U0Z26_18790 [Anaerolineales bacterium]